MEIKKNVEKKNGKHMFEFLSLSLSHIPDFIQLNFGC